MSYIHTGSIHIPQHKSLLSQPVQGDSKKESLQERLDRIEAERPKATSAKPSLAQRLSQAFCLNG